ncbi:heme exporter protein CcmD [Legionella waltersii]|uniref:Heme exporter protein D n=1 Tax=Legionella waltersii TaxID=66969 RepID=A0A0W1AND5_9GAMM|nr:heme exporter protein CcmD [Legionella waltersii]SNV01730.1 cytochrome c-type biogenesis protein CcmD [Legionella waltersii]
MHQFLDWIAMGGYSLYVWPAYFLVYGILLLNVFRMKKHKSRIYTSLKHWFKREDT